MEKPEQKKPAPEPILALPSELSSAEQRACINLVYYAIRLTLEAKGQLTDEQRATLASAVDALLAGEGRCKVFALAVAIWLRDKKELGNRLISAVLLAQCATRPALQPFVRRSCKLVLKLPSDLQDLLTEFEIIAGGDAKRPTCIKKAAKDVVENLPPFQAVKYDNREKIKRTKAQLKKAEEVLSNSTGMSGAKKGKGKGKLGMFGKAAADDALAETKNRSQQEAVDALKSKLRKLANGNLGSLIRYTHACKDSEKLTGILRKRYPLDEEEFVDSRLPGDFEESRVGTRMRVQLPEGTLLWDHELSANGNVPATWAQLLSAKNDRGVYTLPYMALLRNLRNVLLMGLRPDFLRKHVLQRLPERRQIQGSGQTATSISHTWSMLEKEFDKAKLEKLQSESESGVRNIWAYKSILKKIRGPLLGTDDKHIGIIGEFLGQPVWEPCGLRLVNQCFLTLNKVQLRDGQVLASKAGKGKSKGKGKSTAKGGKSEGSTETEKWLPVALQPVTPAFLAEVKVAFEQAIEVAASCAIQPMPLDGYPEGPVLLWMDYSNPPLDCVNDKHVPESARLGKKPQSAQDLWLSGIPYDPMLITTLPGQEVELDEISTHKQLCLELRYFCNTYMDYNIHAFDMAGEPAWESTFSNTEVRNAKGQNICVHCRDTCSNPSPTEPALRTLHIDLDSVDESTRCMMISSQCFSGVKPASVSIALRECHAGGAAKLKGDHAPHDCKGKLLLAQDISLPLQKGGTAIYACLIRDANDPSTWIFRNTMDLSLDSMTHVAHEVSKSCRDIFRQLFHAHANMSTTDLNRVGNVRFCQIYQALTVKKSDRQVRVVATGIKKRQLDATAESIDFQSRYTSNLELATALRTRFSSKAVDIEQSLKLALGSCGETPPCVIFRVGMNSLVPVTTLSQLRARAGRALPYASIDGRGHLFGVLDALPSEGALFLPGQVESCVTLLRKLMESPALEVGGHDALIRYVDAFLPRTEFGADEPMEPAEDQQKDMQLSAEGAKTNAQQ